MLAKSIRSFVPSFSRSVFDKIYPSCRKLSVGRTLRVRRFEQFENAHASYLMKNVLKYDILNEVPIAESTLTPNEFETLLAQNWEAKTTDELVSVFESLSNHAHHNTIHIYLEKFDGFVDALTDNIEKMNDEELKRVFVNLFKWPEGEVCGRNYVEVWAALDDALMDRFKKYNVQKMLMFADYVYLLGLTKKFESTFRTIQILERKSKSLTKEQFVRAMFLYATYRKNKFMIVFETPFKMHIDDMSVEELGIACMGFFKTKTSIKDKELMSKILEKIIVHVNDADELILSMILKLIRLSSVIDMRPQIVRLLDLLTPRIDELSLLCCIQICLVGTKALLCHPPSLNRVAQKFVENPSVARLKDLERLIFIFSEYYFIPKTSIPFLDTVVNELRKCERSEEFRSYGKCAVRCLSFLTTFMVFPKDVIDKILDENFLKKTYPLYPYIPRSTTSLEDTREILTLNNSVKIECEDYNGNEISKKASLFLARRHTDYIPIEGHGMNRMEKNMFNIMNKLKDLRGGENFVHGDHVLPHYQKGVIIISNSPNNKPVEVKHHFPEEKFGTIIRAPDNINTWFAIMIISAYTHMIDRVSYLGPINVQRRQLQKIGYKPIVLTFQFWENLRSDEEKEIYLHNIIRQHSDKSEDCILNYNY